LDPADLYKTDGTGLMSAVVSLGGGTGEFISKEGLILTNHHVAFGAIQRASDREHDYITNGFQARTRAEEIPSAGSIADVLERYEEITIEVKRVLKPGMSPLQKAEMIEKRIKEIIAREEKKRPDIICSVRSMYNGNQYFLFIFKRLKDIRLVYTPPLALGNFGGETDNWIWPRHTCDFAILRAYASPGGYGAAFHKDNVPYRPRRHLSLSLEGVREGDFTFIMGYPGRTYRNQPAAEMKLGFDNLRKRIETNLALIEFFETAGKSDRGIEIKYASRVKGLYNSLKNTRGKLEGLDRYRILSRVMERDNRFQQWADSTTTPRKDYAVILPKINTFIKEFSAFSDEDESLGAIVGTLSSTLLSQAYTIYRTALERQKPDARREMGFQDRDLPMIRQRIEIAERGYDLKIDQRFFQFALERLVRLYAGRLPKAIQEALPETSIAKISTYVERTYGTTKMSDPKIRLAMLDMTPAQLRSQNDPLIQLASAIEAEMNVRRPRNKEFNQRLTDLKEIFEAGLLAMNDNRLAPDANGTLRFTCGPVSGYTPRDAVRFSPITTLAGVIEKETGAFPFVVPEKLKELHRSRDYGTYADAAIGDIPACFLNTTNVTGGNSGSPVFNAKGEQVGIIFDMTYESVTGDYCIIPELQRSISVDIRYVLFVLDKFSGASHILAELSIVK